MREGRFSLDQVGVIAEKAADGSDAYYAEMAAVATVTQLCKAIKLEPKPEPEPQPEPPPRSISKTGDEQSTTYKITLPHDEAAIVDAALDSHRDALITAWKHDHTDADGRQRAAQAPPMPNTVDGFMSLVVAGWDAEVARRPHAQRTTVVVHVDLESRIAALHLGPLLSDDDRRYLTCDATCEVWFERDGRVIGAGRATRTVGRRLRRVLEHRDRCCVVPGCGATRGLHAHHIHLLGGRRPYRTRQSGFGLPVPPSGAPSRRHHHHRTRPPPRRHRPGGQTAAAGFTGSAPDQTPAEGQTVFRADR